MAVLFDEFIIFDQHFLGVPVALLFSPHKSGGNWFPDAGQIKTFKSELLFCCIRIFSIQKTEDNCRCD